MATAQLLEFLPQCGMWSLTPYQLCEYRCLYCKAWAQGTSRPTFAPAEFAARLADALRMVRPGDYLTVGALADAYPTIEERLGLTRAAIAALIARHIPFGIVTKGTVVLRDVDLLVPYREHVRVHVSLSTLDEGCARRLEPLAPRPRERLSVLERLRSAGLRVQVSAAPWIPGVSDAAALIACTHPEVTIQFAPLEVAHFPTMQRLVGRSFSQREVNRLYRLERARIGSSPRVRWLYPPAPQRGKSAARHAFAVMP